MAFYFILAVFTNHHHLNSHVPGESGLAGSLLVFFLYLNVLEQNLGDK